MKTIEQVIELNLRIEKQNQELIEQNRRLGEQNQGLIDQMSSFRQSVASQTGQAQAPAPAASAEASSSNPKSILPVASEGSPAIFGEFNPGRGFTVGKS